MFFKRLFRLIVFLRPVPRPFHRYLSGLMYFCAANGVEGTTGVIAEHARLIRAGLVSNERTQSIDRVEQTFDAATKIVIELSLVSRVVELFLRIEEKSVPVSLCVGCMLFVGRYYFTFP